MAKRKSAKLDYRMDASLQSYLDRFHLPPKIDNVYILGVLEQGVTVLKQQHRALNLVYALHEGRVLKPKGSVAVVGAGISGITCASALLSLGYKVNVFEQGPTPCHLQEGCDTRWLHPHIYDWPDRGSTHPSAQLPFLTWRAGMASEVITQLKDSWNEIASRFPDRLYQLYNVNIRRTGRKLDWQGTGSDGEHRDWDSKKFDCVILSVGFGIEKEYDQHTPSYWRNDSLNQTRLDLTGRPLRILVSGVGDGGLIDLLRSTIRGFRQDKIIAELFHGEDSLLQQLQAIQAQRRSNHEGNETWLYDELKKLSTDPGMKRVDKRLRSRLRIDTSVALNGSRPLPVVLSNPTVSFLNTLLVQRIQPKEWTFHYLQGRIAEEEGLVRIGKQYRLRFEGQSGDHFFDEVVVRHGVAWEETLNTLGCESDDILKMKTAVQHIPANGAAERLWPPAWWSKNAIPKFPIHGRVNENDHVEYVTTATRIVADTFVSTLAQTVMNYRPDNGHGFRAALLRSVRFNTEQCLQQISAYHGTGTRESGSVSRVFPISTGMMGLCARTGKIITASSTKGLRAFQSEQRSLLGGTKSGARSMASEVRSILCIPLCTASDTTSLVLFMDSTEAGFFANKEVVRIAVSGCLGFIRNLQKPDGLAGMRVIDSYYAGIPHDFTSRDLVRYKTISELRPTNSEKLVFERLHFIDIVYDVGDFLTRAHKNQVNKVPHG